MPFNNIDDFLGREYDPKASELLLQCDKYFQKLIYFGGEIFNEILKKNLGTEDSLPLIMFFRNSIEVIDSISVLVRNFCSEPSKILLRTLLETYLYIEFLSEKDTKKRSLSFLICHYHQKLDFNYKLDPKTEQGLILSKKLENDDLLNNYTFSHTEILEKQRSILEELFREEIYVEVEKEYQRLRKRNRRKPIWYEFYEGPTNIEKLSEHLKVSSFYQFLYKTLSKSTHGNSIIDGYIAAGQDEGEVQFSQIRFPYSVQMIYQFTFILALRIYESIIKVHIPQYRDRYNLWFDDEIREFYNKITSEKLIVYKNE